MAHHPLLGYALGATLLVAACSGGGGDASPATTAESVTTVSSPPTSIADDTTDTTTVATSPDTATPEPDLRYQATIVRTSFNIPHITAPDLGGLGYGYGYAIAEDHLCTIADSVVQARGQAAKFFGPGPDDVWLNQDIVYQAMDLYERARVDFDNTAPDLQDQIRGYAAGFNRYLADTGVDAVPGYCSGAAWVGPIDAYDLSAMFKALSWRASVDPLKNFIATATPPAVDDQADVTEDAFGALPLEEAPMASNAWAIGPDRTEDGTTMLVGNPHFPWQGANRFYEVQLTVPGVVNAYGVSLIGSPVINIGFTDGVAWSHTVSAGHRFTAYTLDLVEGDPTSYYYGDEVRAMTPVEVSVEVGGDTGDVTTLDRTVWFSHYGPIINFPGLGWGNDLVLTFRDANADNDEQTAQFAAMNLAESMDDLIDAHATYQGIPWVNTIAASAEGRIWYADTASAPKLSAAAVDAWTASVAAGGLPEIALDNGVILLDGSDPLYEWVDVTGARDPGLVPFDEMPQLERTDFVFNANDPYWLANPEALADEMSPVHGRYGAPVSPRTRGNANQLSIDNGDAGDDGLFSRVELRDSSVGNRVFTAEALVDEVVGRCRAEGAEPAICEVLDNWDRRVDLDSVGAGLWRGFINSFGYRDLLDAGPLWKNPFDPSDPVNTPNGLSDDPEIVDRLVGAADELRADGFDIDTPLGEMQYTLRGNVRVPLHGGQGREGVSNVVSPGSNSTTSETSITSDEPGDLINFGTSFIYNIEFTADGPVAEALLTYGESGDPTSEFFSDQTLRFSEKQWRPILFTPEAIDADPNRREYTIAE